MQYDNPSFEDKDSENADLWHLAIEFRSFSDEDVISIIGTNVNG